jgi:hypothetical protein
MSYVIKHKLTAELFTCTLINIYDFEYHGVKVWDTSDAAQAEFASFLLERGVEELWDWEVFELTENQTKMGNVKLNNNAAKRLYLNAQGKLETK